MKSIIALKEISAIVLSLKAAFFCSIIAFPISLFIGWILARKDFIGKTILDSFVHIPIVIPPVTVGYILLCLFGSNGPLGRILFNVFGLRIAFSFYAVILASFVVATPLFIRSIRIAIEMVDIKYEEASFTLGKNSLLTFFKVTLPLSLPGIISGFILSFARSLGEFGATMVIAGNIEGKTQTLPLAIYSLMQIPGGEVAAFRLAFFSVLISIGALTCSRIFEKRLKRKINGT